MSPPALFPSLIGPVEWSRLAEPVRRMHGGTASLRAHGQAQVDGAEHLFARVLRRVLGLPEPGPAQAITLTIERAGSREIWTRHFASRRMRSTLDANGESGRLCERLGPVAFSFELRRVDDAIDWALCEGRLLGVRLPRAVFGSVFSRSMAEHGRYLFHIDTRLPLVGRLVSYRGWLEVEG